MVLHRARQLTGPAGSGSTGNCRAPGAYERRAILRIIVRNLPSECRSLRSFVTSDGMGGAVPSGDERGPVVAGSVYGYGYGYGAVGSVMTSFLGLDGKWGGARTLADAQRGRHQLPAAAEEAGPGSWPGRFHQTPASSAGTRHCEPRGHQRSC